MGYHPIAIANTFITRHAQESGLEHMKLQKLAFYCRGWWLALKGREDNIVDAKPEVWRYGPVFSSMYNAFAKYRAEPIKTVEKLSPFSAPPIITNNDDAIQMIDWVWNRYGPLSSLELSRKTHEPGTPWHVLAERYNYQVPRHLEIDDDIMESYFKSLAQEEGITATA